MSRDKLTAAIVVGMNGETSEIDGCKSSENEHLQTTVSESQCSAFDFNLSQDSVIGKFHDSSSQDDELLMLSQVSQILIKKYAPDIQSQRSQIDDYDVSKKYLSFSQQSEAFESNPPPLSQDSLAFADSAEQQDSQFDVERSVIVSEHKSKEKKHPLNPISLSDENENDNDISDDETKISCTFGPLSQEDHSVATFAGDMRHVFDKESFSQQSLSQLSYDPVVRDANMARKRHEIGYSEKISFPYDAKTDHFNHAPKNLFGTTSAMAEHSIHPTLLLAAEQRQILEGESTISNVKVEKWIIDRSTKRDVKAEEENSTGVIKNTKKRVRKDNSVPESAEYISLTVTEPSSNQVTPSTNGSVCSVGRSSGSISTPTRRGHRGYKKAKTEVGSLSPIGPHAKVDKEARLMENIKDSLVLEIQQSPKATKSRKQKVTKTPSKLVDDDDELDDDNNEDHLEIAKQAADLAQRAMKDENLANRLLLNLILTREKPGTSNKLVPAVLSKYADAASATAANPYFMPAGFQWCEYPPLEGILKQNRKKYYEMSMNPTLRQTVEQLSFNNKLVNIIRQFGLQFHWIFYNRKGSSSSQDSTSTVPKNVYNWTDKALRDRIRFYYKTNKQNAMGRLKTMLKNPSKQSNARNLNALFKLQLLNTHNGTTGSTGCSSSSDDMKIHVTIEEES